MQLQLSLLCHQVSSAAPNLGSGDFITALAALAKLELVFFHQGNKQYEALLLMFIPFQQSQIASTGQITES